jgi:serine/threonine protein kinase
MHKLSFVHRDFKPGNIFMGRSGELILGDAGLAYSMDERKRATETVESVGTRHYKPAWAYGGRLEGVNPTFDVFSVGKVIWAMIAGESSCPLWYVLKDKYNLELRFPNQPEMLWVNALLSKCVVEEEKEMRLRDGSSLLNEMDVAMRALRLRAIPPDKALVVRSCRICFVGTYVEDNSGNRGGIVYPAGHCFRCDRCGHLEFFMTSSMTKR